MKKIEINDLYNLNFLSDISYSPNGKNALFFVHVADEKKNNYNTKMWNYNVESGVKLLAGNCSSGNAIWLDSETILFSSAKREEVSKDETAFYRLSLLGGEATHAFTVPKKVKSILSVSDNLFLITCLCDISNEKEEREFHAKKGVDFEIFDELPFWENGRGIINKIRTAAMLFDCKENKLTEVSPTNLEVSDVVLSAAKDKVVFCGIAPVDGVKRQESGMWIYDIVSSSVTPLIPQGNMIISNICYAENNIFYTGSNHEWPGKNPGYYLFDLESRRIQEFPFPDAPVGSSVSTDSSYGGGRGIKYSDGCIYMLHTVHGDTHLVSFDLNGNKKLHHAATGLMQSFDVVGSNVLFVGMCDMRLSELFSFDLKSCKQLQITSFNDEFFNNNTVIIPETFTFKNSDGDVLDGYVIKPVDFQSGNKYPCVLEIHGGPKVSYGAVFNHEMQVLAAKGYFVIYTNPRGSDGRGEDFSNLTGKLGTIDYHDLMEFLNVSLIRYPEIDDSRLAACGGSYGGFMVNWMIGHSNRFKVACAQRCISNYTTKCLTTDIGYIHNLKQIGADPWQGFDTMWDTSPLQYAKNANTPTLFIQSYEDYRCWLSEPLQMFTSLRRRGIASKIVLYNGENHNLSRTGAPNNRISRLNEIVNWFNMHM